MPVLIRSTAKAIILHEGRILLNRCADSRNGTYYALPGGGQNQFEPLEDAVVRECLEETGYRVHPVRLIAVCEEIWNDAERRQKYPEYAHRMLHIFLCTLDGIAPSNRRDRSFPPSRARKCPYSRILRGARSAAGDTDTAPYPGYTYCGRTSRQTWARSAGPNGSRCRTLRRGTNPGTGIAAAIQNWAQTCFLSSVPSNTTATLPQWPLAISAYASPASSSAKRWVMS